LPNLFQNSPQNQNLKTTHLLLKQIKPYFPSCHVRNVSALLKRSFYSVQVVQMRPSFMLSDLSWFAFFFRSTEQTAERKQSRFQKRDSVSGGCLKLDINFKKSSFLKFSNSGVFVGFYVVPSVFFLCFRFFFSVGFCSSLVRVEWIFENTWLFKFYPFLPRARGVWFRQISSSFPFFFPSSIVPIIFALFLRLDKVDISDSPRAPARNDYTEGLGNHL